MKEKENDEIDKNENKEINIINEDKNKISQEPEKQKEEIPNSKKKNKYNLMELNIEFDEILYFNNYFSVFRKIEFENPITQNSFPYLVSREFNYSYFEDKRIIKSTSQETKNQIIGRIKQYSITRDEKFTKFFLDNMNSYAEAISLEETSNFLLPALAKIVDETVAVKIYFLKKISNLIDFLSSKGDEGVNLLKKNVINILEELYHPHGFEINDEEMKKLLFDNFIKAAKAIIPKDKDNYILNMIVSFGYEENANKDFILEHKILCIKFISKLSEFFGKENAINYLLPQLNFFADEQEQNIKKELLKSLPSICEVLPYDIIRSKIYKIIKRLVGDPLWRIRKTCAEVIPHILKIYKEKADEYIKNEINYDKKKLSVKHYINLIEKLSLDDQKFVRHTILEKIGEIITSISKDYDELPIKLFNFYKESAENYYFNKSKIMNSDTSSENTIKTISTINSKGVRVKYSTDDINFYFAYNFPAVLYIFGKEYWPKLRKIYSNLCNESNPKIRSSIISSFDEICKIIDKENIEIDLLQYYDIFLESEDNKEKNIAIRHLPKILNLVSKETRQKYLKYFEAVSIFKDNQGEKIRNFNFISWKNKLDVIEGILCYFNLYDTNTIYKFIIPQCIIFCLDRISKVRTVSSKVLGNVIKYLFNEKYDKNKIYKLIESFAFHKKFHQRINFVKICKILINNIDLFNDKIKDIFFIIALNDKNLNVKIALCKLIQKILINDKHPLYNNIYIHQLYKLILSKEKSVSIKNIFKDIILEEIKDKNEINDINKYIYDKEIFIGNNKYFIKEFNVVIEDEKIDNEDNEINIEENKDNIVINNNSDNDTENSKNILMKENQEKNEENKDSDNLNNNINNES